MAGNVRFTGGFEASDDLGPLQRKLNSSIEEWNSSSSHDGPPWRSDRSNDPIDPNAIIDWPKPRTAQDAQDEILRSRIAALEDENLRRASHEAELAARIRVLEADKARLEEELARRKPRLGEARTVED